MMETNPVAWFLSVVLVGIAGVAVAAILIAVAQTICDWWDGR